LFTSDLKANCLSFTSVPLNRWRGVLQALGSWRLKHALMVLCAE
jgi:hypothetical protein